MNRFLIIEDEKPNADRLKRLLKQVRPGAIVLAVLESIADCTEWLGSHESPDVILMDIRLSDGLSFDIFEKVQVNCPVIFTTAYDEYAVRAFKFNSVDYLLKPVELEELTSAIEKLEAWPAGQYNRAPLDGLLDFLKPRAYRSRFLLPYRDGYKSVLVAEIAYFYSELKVSRARLHNGMDEVLPQTLEELEQQLDPRLFFRANRQYIVHIDALQQVHNYFNGKLKVQLKNNPAAEIIVSREKAAQLKAWLDY